MKLYQKKKENGEVDYHWIIDNTLHGSHSRCLKSINPRPHKTKIAKDANRSARFH